VRDRPEELALALLPGTECMAEESYGKGKQHSKRWYDFKDRDWKLETYVWRTNRLLLLLEPECFYSTIFFWNQAKNQFICFYINFQLPFVRNDHAIDTLDLELDIIIHPDLSYEWKDVEDYHRATQHGLITPEWVKRIDEEIPGILDRVRTRQYPFDGSWLDWMPDPAWSPPTLPENWDKI
jgi:protein associated with RNAse G/E